MAQLKAAETSGLNPASRDALVAGAAIRQDTADDLAETGRTLLQDSAELGSAWLSSWREQINDNVATLQQMGQCRDGREVLDLQVRFLQASADRTMARFSKSLELASRILTSAAQQSALRNLERSADAAE